MPGATSASARRLARAILVTAMSLELSGCSAWHQKHPPGAYLADHSPDRVRVALRDGSRMELKASAVAKDSLVGELELGQRAAPNRRALAVAEIAKLEVREFDLSRTSILVLGIVALTFAVVVASLTAPPGL